MPDAPISTTPRIDLSQWGEKSNPGASALNANWQKIDDAIAAVQDAIEAIDFSGKADQSAVDAVIADLEALSDAIIAANYIKPDGTVPMAADLDMGSHKIGGVSNGDDPDQAVNRGQLDSAVAAAIGALSGSYEYCLARNTTDQTGTSPQIFSADQNDAESTVGQTLHDTGAPTLFVASQDGFYFLQARMKVADAGGASLVWFKNGAECPQTKFPPILADVGENATFIVDTLLVPLSSGDEITLKVYGLLTEPIKILAGSTLAMTLMLSNAAGGGDVKSDGSVPMTGNLDLGGNKAINSGDAVDPDDLVPLHQVEDLIQVVQDEVDAISSGQLKTPETEMTGGDQAISGTSWVDITGSAITRTFATEKDVAVLGEGTALTDFLRRSNLQLGLKIQRTGDAAAYYPGTYSWSNTLGNWQEAGLTASKKLTCIAGEWTFTLIARQRVALGASTALAKNAGAPARLGIAYTA